MKRLRIAFSIATFTAAIVAHADEVKLTNVHLCCGSCVKGVEKVVAKVKGVTATADQATSTYRQTVLTALQDVEDNLVLADQLQKEAQLQDEALQAAQRNLEITLDQYRAGTVSYLNVVTAQTAALTSQSSLLAVRNRQLAAVNQLLKNIAGRWEPV